MYWLPTEQTAARGSLWLVYKRISIVAANVTERHMAGIGQEQKQPAAECFQKHSQTCTTASTGVSLVTKKKQKKKLKSKSKSSQRPVGARS